MHVKCAVKWDQFCWYNRNGGCYLNCQFWCHMKNYLIQIITNDLQLLPILDKMFRAHSKLCHALESIFTLMIPQRDYINAPAFVSIPLKFLVSIIM